MLDGRVVNMQGHRTAACILQGKEPVHAPLLFTPSIKCSEQQPVHELLSFIPSIKCYVCRGICHKGKDCDYLHQLPTEYHEQLLTSDHTVDIFGRDKLAGSNMGTKGVGTYERESKTLYVHYGGAGHLGAPVIRQLLQVSQEDNMQTVRGNLYAFAGWKS